MKNKVFANASIVTFLSIAERGLGFLYRIVLSRLIGAEGLGLYQVALSLFSLFLTLGTGGIPISVSRMISKSKAENNPQGEPAMKTTRKILLVSLLALLLCAALASCDAFQKPQSFTVTVMYGSSVVKTYEFDKGEVVSIHAEILKE